LHSATGELVQHVVLPRGLAHPIEIAQALLDGQVEVHARQLLAEGAAVELAFDLAQASQFLRRPRASAVGQGRAFHRFSHSKYIATSGSQAKALAGSKPVSTRAALASPMYLWRP
jgi:hypothetical protein